MFNALFHDEAGFIVTAELVLVASLLTIGLIVGLNEAQHAVVAEFNNFSDSMSRVNQSASSSGFSASRKNSGQKSSTFSFLWADRSDNCDHNQCDISCDSLTSEG